MENVEAVLKLLRSEDPDQVREGAFEAGERKMLAAVPLLVESLKRGHLGIQDAADAALRGIGGPETIREIIPLLGSDEAPLRNLSMDILREIGHEDIQTLVGLLHDVDPDIRIFAADILGSTGNALVVAPLCAALLKDPEVNVRYQAAVSLGDLALPEAAGCLNQALNDDEWVQFAVIESLTKVRAKSSISALLKALASSSDLVASMIVEALGEMGDIKAVAILLRRIENSPVALRNKIAKAIVKIMGGKSLALLSEKQRENLRQYLLAALKDEDEEIQDAAISGLASVGGEAASEAVLRIASGLSADMEPERLDRAVNALASIGPNEALARALAGGEGNVAIAAAEAVSRMAPEKTGDVLAAMREYFWDKGRDAQRAFSKALATLASADEWRFFNDVCAKHNDGHVLKNALHYLGVKHAVGEATDTVCSLMEHEYDDVKEAALEACIAIGGDEVMRRFKTMLRGPEPLDRMMGVYGVGRLGGLEEREELIQALEDEVPDIRKVALEALGANCVESVEAIVPRLNDENEEVRLTVVEILGKCQHAEVMPYLMQALEDEADWVKIRAVEALARRKETGATAGLAPLLESENKLLILKVVEALGEIGDSEAFQALLALLEHQDPEINEAARQAVDAIQSEQGEGI